MASVRGVMALRTVANGTQRTTRDFINDLSGMTPEQVRHADLSRYARHQPTGNFDAMVTSRNAEKQLDGDEYRSASALLGRFYEIIVVDTANNEAHEAFQAAIEDATVLVVPTKWRPTHITPATAMLNDMAAISPRHQLLVRNAVVVASNGVGEAIPGAREMAKPIFSSLAHTWSRFRRIPLSHPRRGATDRETICQAIHHQVGEVAELLNGAGLQLVQGLGPRRLGALIRHCYTPSRGIDDLAGLRSARDGFPSYPQPSAGRFAGAGLGP